MCVVPVRELPQCAGAAVSSRARVGMWVASAGKIGSLVPGNIGRLVPGTLVAASKQWDGDFSGRLRCRFCGRGLQLGSVRGFGAWVPWVL